MLADDASMSVKNTENAFPIDEVFLSWIRRRNSLKKTNFSLQRNPTGAYTRCNCSIVSAYNWWHSFPVEKCWFVRESTFLMGNVKTHDSLLLFDFVFQMNMQNFPRFSFKNKTKHKHLFMLTWKIRVINWETQFYFKKCFN